MALRNTISVIYLNVCLLIFSLLSSSIMKAQDTLSGSKDSIPPNSSSHSKDSLKHNFYINALSNVPLGDFKSADYNKANAGYAKTGYGADLGYSYRIWKGLGLGLNLSYGKNSIDEKKLADQIKEITINQTSFTTIYSSSTPAYWETYSISGGLNYQFWFGSKKNIGIEPTVFIGESFVYTPNVVYNVRIDNLTFETRNSRKGCWAFLHREGLNLNYLIGSRTIAHINASYFSVSGNGNDMEHEVVGNKTYSRTLIDYNFNISSIYLGLGITTRF